MGSAPRLVATRFPRQSPLRVSVCLYVCLSLIIYYKVKSKPEAEASLEAPLLRDAPFYFFLLLLPNSLLEQEAPVSLAMPTQAVSLRATLTT